MKSMGTAAVEAQGLQAELMASLLCRELVGGEHGLLGDGPMAGIQGDWLAQALAEDLAPALCAAMKGAHHAL